MRPKLAGVSAKETTGLILTGGGARAAYQVGVLRAIARIRRSCHGAVGNPFDVIAGTSAGAINAAALAARADRFDVAVAGLVEVWRNFSAEQVYRADTVGVIRTGASWLTMLTVGWAIARWRRARPASLLDNRPLHALLKRLIPLHRIPDVMRRGHLQALAVTASSYTGGVHVTFYDTLGTMQPWERSQRLAVNHAISVEHLLASSAIPFVFPPVQLPMAGRDEWFGDGSMRQVAPISPAIHLGAQRILVIGAGRLQEPPGWHVADPTPPNLAQIGGHALSSIFLDALPVDIERLQRINRTVSLLSDEARVTSGLRPIELLVIAPSERIDDVAARHLGSLSPAVRGLLRAVGVSGDGENAQGAALASYLLFEAPFTRELIEMGVGDTLARADEVASFFRWDRRGSARHPITPTELSAFRE